MQGRTYPKRHTLNTGFHPRTSPCDSVLIQAQVVDAAISESMFNMLEGCVAEAAMHGYDRPPSGSTLTGEAGESEGP